MDCCSRCEAHVENKGFTEAFYSKPIAFDCKHNIHFPCFVQWTDTRCKQEPHLRAVECPTCHKASHIPTLYSTTTLLKWIDRSEKTGFCLGVLLGVALGLLVLRQAKHYPLLERFCAEIPKQTLLPASIWLSGTGAALTMLGCLSLQPHLRPWIEKVAIATYNLIYRTRFATTDVWDYHYSFTDPLTGLSNSDITVFRSMHEKVFIELMSFLIDLDRPSFHQDDQQYITEVRKELQPWQEAKSGYLTGSFIADLHSAKTDTPKSYVYGKVRHNIEKLFTTEKEFQDQFNMHLNAFFLSFFTTPSFKKSRAVISDSKVALRIALCQAIHMCTKRFPSKITPKGATPQEVSSPVTLTPQEIASWFALTDKFQKECQEDNSPFLCAVQAKMQEVDFSKIPLIRLLFDKQLCQQIDEAFIAVKQEEAKEAGFILRPKKS